MSVRTKEYILTESGNHISRKGLNLVSTQSIILGGKTIIEPYVTIRGDLKRSSSNSGNSSSKGTEGAVSIGRYCILRESSRLVPPHKLRTRTITTPSTTGHDADTTTGTATSSTTEEKVYYPMKLGDYIDIGPSSLIESATISSFVQIGARCHLGNMSVVKEGCIIEDDTIVAPFSVIAPFSRVSGKPGLVVGETPEVVCDLIREELRDGYAQKIGQRK